MPGPARSKGCYRCRSKKIKCDEERPECKRCKGLGIKCPGFRPENELVFCNMNDSVEEQVFSGPPRCGKQRSLATSKPRKVVLQWRDPTIISSTISRRDSPSTDKNTSQEEASWALVKQPERPTIRSMSTDWNEHALCRFYADYVVDTDDLHLSPGFLDSLPRLRNNLGSKNIVLGEALSAVSLANFSNQVRSKTLQIQGRKSYGRGLAQLHKALSEGLLTSDDVLAGVILLNMYEMFSGDKSPQKSVWETHGDALGLLLRVRGTSEQFISKDSGGISRAAHRIIMMKNLLRRTAPGPESSLYEESADPDTPWNQVHLACNRISRLLPIADSILAEEPCPGEQSNRLLEIIRMIQHEDSHFQELATGNSGLSDSFSAVSNLGSRHSLKPLVGASEAISWFVHRSWNVYRAARIILLQTLLNLGIRALLQTDLSHLAQYMQNLQLQTSKYIYEMVDCISNTTEVVLIKLDGRGWSERGSQDGKAIAGYTSVFPLKVASSVKMISDEQRKHIGGQLEFIETTLGLRQAQTIRRG